MNKHSQTAEELKKDLQTFIDPDKSRVLGGFFKTGKGQYSENDVFIGVSVPENRQVCRKFKSLSLGEIQKLLRSKVHEHRLAGLIILVDRCKKHLAPEERKKYFEFYVKNLREGNVNNWDLVDVSAPDLLGRYLLDRPGKQAALVQFASSDNIWHRRAAMVATFAFIKAGQSEQTVKIATLLLDDKRDLVQKAVGWMLREMGKKVDQSILLQFLEQHYKTMPRTALRYSIERLSPKQRSYFMKK